MNRSAFIPLFVLGAAGAGCALLITVTYAVLRIPLPFSVLLSCVVMTTAVAMMAIRWRQAAPERTAADAGSAAPRRRDTTSAAAAQGRVLLLPAGAAAGEEQHGAAGGQRGGKQHRTGVDLTAITLFDLPSVAREQEAA